MLHRNTAPQHLRSSGQISASKGGTKWPNYDDYHCVLRVTLKMPIDALNTKVIAK